jgi:hypothetical protein
MIINSDITANDDVPANSYYLGRPWQPRASSVFIYCRLGDHIKPEGWSTWDNDNHLSGFYGEYKNTDFEGNPIDISQRVDWSSQISDARIENFYKYDFFFKKNGEEWDAETVTKALIMPRNIETDGTTLSWDAVEDAIGYIVYLSGTLFAITEQNSVAVEGIQLSNVEVKSVRENGVLSNDENKNLLTFVNDFMLNDSFNICFKHGEVTSNSKFSLSVYNLKGKLIFYSPLSHSHTINHLKRSPYIFIAENAKGEMTIEKHIVINE